MKTHGMSKTKTYQIWSAMIQRCNNKNCKAYKNYGGRGIKVCDRWLTFINFYNDIGPAPPGMDLDRTNNDGNYEPLNCRWVNRSTNLRNRRKLKGTSSKFIGVSLYKSINKWRAMISIGNKNVYLGYFDSEEDAWERYQQAKLELETTGKVTV